MMQYAACVSKGTYLLLPWHLWRLPSGAQGSVGGVITQSMTAMQQVPFFSI